MSVFGRCQHDVLFPYALYHTLYRCLHPYPFGWLSADCALLSPARSNTLRPLRLCAVLTAVRVLAGWCAALGGLQEATAHCEAQKMVEEKKEGKVRLRRSCGLFCAVLGCGFL